MEKCCIMLLDTYLCILLVTLIIISKPLQYAATFKPKNLIMQQYFLSNRYQVEPKQYDYAVVIVSPKSDTTEEYFKETKHLCRL